MAEERDWVSPYNYTQNNPINRIDPDGALDEFMVTIENGEVVDSRWMSNAGGNEVDIVNYVSKDESGGFETLGVAVVDVEHETSNLSGGFTEKSPGLRTHYPAASGGVEAEHGLGPLDYLFNAKAWVDDGVKVGMGLAKNIKLRHYTSNKGLEGIMDDMIIKAWDQNKVFAEKAKGTALSAADASKKYGIQKKDARNYIEFQVDAERVNIVKNPLTQAREYIIKGDVILDPNTTKFRNRK